MRSTPRVGSRSRYPRGIGEPVGVVDAQAVDQLLLDEVEHVAVQRLEHLGLLDAHAGQLVDVEEAAVAAGPVVDVEEPLAQLRVAPEVVLVVGRHVVRDDVEHHAHARVAPSSQSARSAASPPSRSAALRGSITS